MTRTRWTTYLAGAAAVLLIALLAGCGGSDTPSAPKTTDGQAATLGVASTGLGKVLVNGQARTLYLFKGDAGTKSACAGECANDWPPLRATGTPKAGDGAKGSLLATTRRSDGAPQVTYHGHPVYLYEGDKKPGDTNGQDVTAFGAAWYALSPAGSQVEKASDSDGGSGY